MAAAVALATAGAATTLGASTKAATANVHAVKASAQPLAGKKFLAVPYWLDSFGQAFTSWITKDIKALGGSVTIYNSNAVSSAQLNDIDTAIATGKYSGIIWQPNDPKAALSTIKQIQAAKLPQVVFDSSLVPGQDGVTVPQLLVNLKTADTAIGESAARYIKAHPALGAHPEAVWMGISPPQYVCTTREASFLAGLRKVDPKARIVGNLAATSIADADNKMTDFITKGTKFNVFLGCGPSPSDGGIAAIEGAGLAGVVGGGGQANDKKPLHVWMAAESGDTNEYQQLWGDSTSLMAVNLQGPETSANYAVKLLVEQVEGKIKYNSATELTTPWTPLYTDCTKYRPLVLAQYKGVSGFTIPSCPRS